VNGVHIQNLLQIRFITYNSIPIFCNTYSFFTNALQLGKNTTYLLLIMALQSPL